MHEQIDDNKTWYQNTAKDLLNEHMNTALIVLQLASYCFQSLIGLANLLLAISCYKFHILKI